MVFGTLILAISLLAILASAFWCCWRLSRRKPQPAPALTLSPAPDSAAGQAQAREENMDVDILDGAEEMAAAEEESPRQRKRLSLLGELAAGMAHEINNPIAIMIEEAGWIEDLLEDEKFSKSRDFDEVKRALQQIKTQGIRCKSIIQNLLSFGRKTSIKTEDVQLNDLIAETVKSYDKRVRSGNVSIEMHLDNALPTIRLSPSEVQQVLANMINNALDAMDGRSGSVRMVTRMDGSDAVIDIADDGHGIPKDSLEKIFDPFFTTKPVGKGTGLGLSICYGLIEKMGGEISVDSETGVGTTFHIRIPVRKRDGPSASQPEAARREAPGAEAPGAESTLVPSPTVVLVVDDEVPFVEALRKRLSRRNLQVLTAYSGEHGLRELQHKRDIDVIVLDVKMPGMDGIETLREIKATRPLVEVILLSAHTTVESAIEGIKMGAFDYLLKPCDVGQLVDQIEKAKRRKRRQEQKIMEARIKEITSRRI